MDGNANADEMLNEFAVVANEGNLVEELKQRYDGIADRLTLYTPFVPGEKDAWWRELTTSINN